MCIRDSVIIGISECIYYHTLITELLLKNVYKEFWKEQSGYGTLGKSVRNVKRYLEICRPHSKRKIIIICRETEAADALSAMLGNDAVKVTEETALNDRLNIVRDFQEQNECKVIIGTKILADLEDVQNVFMVLLMDYVPSIRDFVKYASMVTEEIGIISTIFCDSSFDIDSMTLDCPTSQIKKYYNIKNPQPCNCCNKFNNDVKELLFKLHGK